LGDLEDALTVDGHRRPYGDAAVEPRGRFGERLDGEGVAQVLGVDASPVSLTKRL
jgi:hypothetical protein